MPTTPNKGIEIPTTGSLSGTWGDVLNADSFTVIDSNLGGTVTKTLSSSPVTLSATEAQNGIVRLIGTLSSAVTVTTPCLGFFYVENLTTGNYAVTLQYTGAVGGTVLPIQNCRTPVISDATNGLRVGMSMLPPGAIIDYAGSNTGPHPSLLGEFLFCDGSAVSRTTYSALFAALGTTWGAGNGSTTFNVPDFRGRTRFGRDDMGGSAAGRLTTAGGGIDGASVGAVGGAQNVTLTAGMLPANIPNSAVSSTTSTSTVIGGSGSGSWNTGTGAGLSGPLNPTGIGITSSTTTTVTINSSGGTTAVKTVPPAGVVNTFIKI